MTTMLAIAVGGALGAMARYSAGLGAAVLFGPGFPYGTLLVNAIGSFAIGLSYVFIVEGTGGNGLHRAFIMIGFLGAFTTFSTFSLDTLQLIESGELMKSLLNVGANVSLCFFACWLGLLLAR
jgi:CrcB protein